MRESDARTRPLRRRIAKVAAKTAATHLLPPELFDPRLPLAEVRRLFSLYVHEVEIENHSYCNRVCWFCPNAQIDRRSHAHVMAESVWQGILEDLETVQYRGALIWSRYHEPMAHTSVFDRLLEARERLPDAYFVMVSNGDYLNGETLVQLEAGGLDRLMLDLYMPEGSERDEVAVAQAIQRFEARTGLTAEPQGAFEYRMAGTMIDATMGVPNYTVADLSTRGGLVEIDGLADYRRTAVCFNPLRSVVVDYNGEMVLCCQARSDAPAHRQAGAVIGSTAPDAEGNRRTLFELWRAMAGAREVLLSPGPKTGICTTCTVSDTGPNRLARRRWSRHFAALPLVRRGTELVARMVTRRRPYE